MPLLPKRLVFQPAKPASQVSGTRCASCEPLISLRSCPSWFPSVCGVIVSGSPSSSFAGSKYYIVDFQYELLTGAGFTVERKGVAGVTQVKILAAPKKGRPVLRVYDSLSLLVTWLQGFNANIRSCYR